MYLWRNARVRTKVATCLLVATLAMAAFAATVVAGAVNVHHTPAVAVRLHAYVALLNTKETSGQERAQLATTFTVGRFAEGQFATVVSLIASQQAYLNMFERSAPTDVQNEWSGIRTSPAFSQVAAFEKTALTHGTTGGFGV